MWNVEVNSSSFGLKCGWIVVYNHWFVSAEISGINVAVPPPVRPFFAQTTTASRVVLPWHNQLIFGIIFVFIIVVV